MFVVETILSSQFARINVFISSNLTLKHAYINLSKFSIVCCISRSVQLRDIIYSYTFIYINTQKNVPFVRWSQLMHVFLAHKRCKRVVRNTDYYL